MKRNYSVIFLIIAMCFATASIFAPVAHAESRVTSFDNKYVYVESDGVGATRQEAINSAWIEAIRTGVGMFMTGSTKIADDDLKETITAYSRGNVDAYKVLSVDNSNGMWTAKISAKVEKDFLIEPIKTSKSAKISSNDVAKVLTQARQSEDAASTIENFRLFENPGDLLDYSFTVKHIDGKIYAFHMLQVNFSNYQNIVMKNADQLLTKLAKKKESKVYPSKKNFRNLLNKKIGEIVPKVSKLDLHNGFYMTHSTRNPNDFLTEGYELGSGLCDIDRRDIDANYSILAGAQAYTKYKINDSLLEKIMHRLENLYKCYAQFYVDAVFGNEKDRIYGPASVFYLAHGYNIIAPILANESGAMRLRTIYIQQLDIPSDKLAKISDLVGGYELTSAAQNLQN